MPIPRLAAVVTVLYAVLLCVACGDSQPTGRRVFFVSPKDGEALKSPAHLEFGSQDFTIAAVPQGTLTDTRPNLGHYHVGVDADCLPVGTPIPKAAPWVHFGMGNSTIEMQLPPGQHKLTLQIGDDLHRTIEGLCSTITVNVTE